MVGLVSTALAGARSRAEAGVESVPSPRVSSGEYRPAINVGFDASLSLSKGELLASQDQWCGSRVPRGPPTPLGRRSKPRYFVAGSALRPSLTALAKRKCHL